MKRLSLLLLFLLLVGGTAYAQTGRLGGCQASGMVKMLESCVAMLQQLTGSVSADIVTITRGLWLRLRQDSARLSEMEAEIPTLISDCDKARNRFDSIL